MCMASYIASDHPLPTSEWDSNRPAFYATGLARNDEEIVRRQFSKPFVYYLGSHEGCGCGFQHGQCAEYEGEHESIIAAQESRRRLIEFVSAALGRQESVELFACWEGDQGAPPLTQRQLRPRDLFRDRCYFLEKEFVVVSEFNRVTSDPD